MEKNIVIGTSAILLTFRCNLKCRLCCTNTPEMPKSLQRDFPLNELEAVIAKYFLVVKYIRKLSFGGGEPTLYNQFSELIDFTADFRDRFEVLEIITNGAAIPRDSVLDTIEKHKDVMFVMIDNYGADISKHAEELSEILTRRGIRHALRCYHGVNAHSGGWVDLGNFEHKHDRDESRGLMKNCMISSKKKNHTAVIPGDMDEGIGENVFYIPYAANTNGLIHRCARAYSTLVAGAVENTTDSFIDIMSEQKSVDEIQNEIIHLFSSDDYPPCEYCNGFDETSVRYEPAEQRK